MIDGDDDRCAKPRCRREAILTHLGKPLCECHWAELCEHDDERAREPLAPKVPADSWAALAGVGALGASPKDIDPSL